MEGNLHLPRLRAGASLTAGMRLLLLFALLLVCVANPVGLTAQTEADRESVAKVIEQLFSLAGKEKNGLARLPGTWSVVIAQFAKGDSRQIEIPAKAGERYQVIGGSESYETDIDICVYGPQRNPVDCDTLEDNYPIVFFTTKTAGVYRAVMTAASVEGGTAYAGMIVLTDMDENRDGAGGGK